jgi:SAM-dependent methyltransferase
MKSELMNLLVCPECASALELRFAADGGSEIESGELVCTTCSRHYPIVRSIPRFVPVENYASNFGFQWNRFRKTQLDSHTGLPLSKDRFFASSGWTPAEMAGKWVLDVGCGAGRFAEVALATGANVVALDYSTAVDACWDNNSPNPRLHVIQGDIYKLPFRKPSFDFVYCLGVLQHTPDVERAFLALPEHARPGGRVAVDVYPKLLRNILWPKYWLRPITKRISQPKLFRLVEWMVRVLLPISLVVGRIPIVGRKLRFAIPVANHEPDWPLSPEQVREWSVLNTYDMLAPAHDHPQDARTLQRWFREGGLHNVEVFRGGHLIGRGIKQVATLGRTLQ